MVNPMVILFIFYHKMPVCGLSEKGRKRLFMPLLP